jgi:hypothetical protein
MMGWPCWCAKAWAKTLSAAVCSSFVIADGIGSRFFSGRRVGIGYAPVGERKELFGGHKRKEPARVIGGRNSCCFWEESILKIPKIGSVIGEMQKRNSLSAGL